MSQREKSGFRLARFGGGDATVLAVSAVESDGISPTAWRERLSRAADPLRSTRGFGFFTSIVVGVAQPAKVAAIPSVIPKPFPFFPSALIRARRSCHVVSVSFCGPAFGVGHPVEPLPDVRRPDARSAQIGGPDDIAQCFQVSAYSGEPAPAKA